ncbi:MAG: hypothetical protein GX752_08900 [Clostridium sp.]|nr:hypothetical protein [Clostridium sp.]
MEIDYKKTFSIVLIALILGIPYGLVVNNTNLNPFVRTMNYSISTDYPNFGFVNTNNIDLSENITGYSDDMLIALTELKESDYNVDKALRSIDENPYPEDLKKEGSKKTREIYNTYSLNAKFVSISFEIIVLISLSYFILFSYEQLKQSSKRKNYVKTDYIMESKK